VRFPPRIGRLADTRGQYLIEFSFCILALWILIFGVIEVSRMVLVYNTVANAARAGVRYAIVRGADLATPASSSDVTTVVTNFAAAAPLTTSDPPLHITVSNAGGSVGSTVKVTVTYAYDPMSTLVPLSMNLSSTSQGVIVY